MRVRHFGGASVDQSEAKADWPLYVCLDHHSSWIFPARQPSSISLWTLLHQQHTENLRFMALAPPWLMTTIPVSVHAFQNFAENFPESIFENTVSKSLQLSGEELHYHVMGWFRGVEPTKFDLQISNQSQSIWSACELSSLQVSCVIWVWSSRQPASASSNDNRKRRSSPKDFIDDNCRCYWMALFIQQVEF